MSATVNGSWIAEPGTWVRALRNDAGIPVGEAGVAAGVVPETGAVLCLFDYNADPPRRVAMLPYQIEPGERPDDVETPEGRRTIESRARMTAAQMGSTRDRQPAVARHEPAHVPVAPVSASGWEVFDPRPCYATISVAGIRLSELAAAQLGGAEAVEIRFDRRRGLIGLAPCAADAPRAVAVRRDGPRVAVVAAGAFVRTLALPKNPSGSAIRYPVTPDKSAGLLVIGEVPFGERAR